MRFVLAILLIVGGGYIILCDKVIPEKNHKIEQVLSAILPPSTEIEAPAFAKKVAPPFSKRSETKSGIFSSNTIKTIDGPRWPSGFV